MTERWEQRLKTLDGVRAPASIQARFERGPTDLQAPPPSTARRVVAGVVAFAVFAAAGVFAWRVLTPTGPTVGESSAPVVTATFDIGSPIVQGSTEEAFPRGRLTALGRTIQGAPNSYTWKIDGGEVNADTIVPDFTSKDYLQIQQGSQLEIEGTADSVTGQLQATGTFPFDLVQDYGTIDDSLTLDAPIGRYVLNLAPSWPEGRVNYYFPIDIVEADPAATSALALSVVGGAEGPQASITSGAMSQEGIRGEFKWCDGSGSCESGVSDFGDAMPLVTFLPVPAGSPLSITGQLQELKGGFFPQATFAREGGRIVSRVTLEEPGTVPQDPGLYYLEIHTAIDGDGSARGTATFWLGIEATGEEGDASPTTSTWAAQPSVAPGQVASPAFEEAPGWSYLPSVVTPGDTNLAMTWVSTRTFAKEDLDGIPSGVLTEPYASLISLDPDDVFIVASFTNPGVLEDPSEVAPDAHLPLSVDEADRRAEWEGQASANVPEYLLWRTVDRMALDVRVYLGTQAPSGEVMMRAQSMLSSMSLPEWDLEDKKAT